MAASAVHSFRPVGFYVPMIMCIFDLWGVYACTGYRVRCIVSVEHDLYKMYIIILTCGCQCRALIPSRWLCYLLAVCWVLCAVSRVTFPS